MKLNDFLSSVEGSYCCIVELGTNSRELDYTNMMRMRIAQGNIPNVEVDFAWYYPKHQTYIIRAKDYYKTTVV